MRIAKTAIGHLSDIIAATDIVPGVYEGILFDIQQQEKREQSLI